MSNNEFQNNQNSLNENYIDFTVEEDVFEPKKKKLPILKIIAALLGIIASFFVLYLAVETLMAAKETIDQEVQLYAMYGIEIPFIAKIYYYSNPVIILTAALAAIAGAMLPAKNAKCSAFLLGLPVLYTLLISASELILCLYSKVAFNEYYMDFLTFIAALLLLASAIMHLFVKYEEPEDDFAEFEEINDIEFENEIDYDLYEEKIIEDVPGIEKTNSVEIEDKIDYDLCEEIPDEDLN